MLRCHPAVRVLMTVGLVYSLAVDRAHPQKLVDRSPAIKAAYLLQIPNYCFWPTEKARQLSPVKGKGELRVLAIGNTKTCLALREIAERQERLAFRLTVRMRSDATAVTREDIDWAHVVYAPAKQDCAAVQSAYPDAPILLVTDGLGGTGSGASVAFYLSENKVRLELAPYNASSRGLQFSARLLRVAGIIRRDSEQARR